MMRRQLAFLFVFLSIFQSSLVYGAPQQLKVPHCLGMALNMPYDTLAENKSYKIISVDSSEIQDIRIIADKLACGRFLNVTEKFTKAKGKTPSQKALKILIKPKPVTSGFSLSQYTKKQSNLVTMNISEVREQNILETLTHLTSYTNRSSILPSGRKPARWLKRQIDDMVDAAGRRDIETYFVETGGIFYQPSLVIKIGSNLKAPGIVIGAHMDTLGKREKDRMPGAGDDGSGSASIMEAARILIHSDLKLKRPIYIIWYSAEELGLVGSQAVVQDFITKQIPVLAAIQFDMTGYRENPEDPTMWLFDDYTDSELTQYLAELIKDYIQVSVRYAKCGYACSDHASWMDEGVPAAFPCESSFKNHNPYIHTSRDTMDLLAAEHMANFTKLALAFAIELAVV